MEFDYNTNYFFMDCWNLANVLQQATIDYCTTFLNYQNDPKRRMYDQMVLAVRSGVANITEGLARQTSYETMLRLLDTARGSIAEVQGDFRADLLHERQVPWSVKDPRYAAVFNLNLDKITFTDDLGHNSGIYILEQWQKFQPWLPTDDQITSANTLYILCKRVWQMLTNLMKERMKAFTQEGGFTEQMTALRLDAKAAQAAEEGNPPCPLCGKPMIKKAAKKGRNAGRPFWSCPDYPRCKGSASYSPPG